MIVEECKVETPKRLIVKHVVFTISGGQILVCADEMLLNQWAIVQVTTLECQAFKKFGGCPITLNNTNKAPLFALFCEITLCYEQKYP